MKELILENLDCANCAAKIEDKLKSMEEIDDANFNFVSKKLRIDTTLDESFLKDKVQIIANDIEPGVIVINPKEKSDPNHDHDHALNTSEENLMIIRLIFGFAIFLIPILFDLSTLVRLLLFGTAYVIVGYSVVLTAFNSLLKGQIFNEHFLMTIATMGAFAIGEYAEGVAVMLFYLVGELLQSKAVNQSRNSIKELMDIKAEYANLVVENGTTRIKPDELKPGDIILIKAGEKIPVDGIVIEGQTMVDTKAITGESVPKSIKLDDEVLSGFINKNGLIKVKVEKEYNDSTVAKIIDLVENASNKKAKTEQFITKFSKYYTPFVVISALILAILPPLLLDGNFNTWIYRALVFLVVSCPCALMISIPVAFIGGIGGASKNGILVKGGNYLEAINDIDTIVFDKTGTLTKGVFNVSNINSYGELSDKELLKLAAIIENNSNHPIADSIVKEYYKTETDDLSQYEIEDYEEISGHGIRARLYGNEYILGNSKLMNKSNIDFLENKDEETIFYISKNNKYIGDISISDEIKEDSKSAIKLLKELGINKTIMLTGDRKTTANKIGKELGIDEVYSELLPQDKVSKIEELISSNDSKSKLAFVGDGINDAPVIARSDLGFAMGGLGSDAAIEAADIVLMTDEISKIGKSIEITKKTRSIALQNIAFALGIKAIFLIMGAAGHATMWEAVFADVGVTVLAILNSMRTLRL